MANRLDGVLMRGEELEFYRAAARGELILGRCADCQAVAVTPRWLCATCGSTRMERVVSARVGSVVSVTTVLRSANPVFEAPYQVAIVHLAEGATMMVDIVGEPCDIGDGIRIEFAQDEGELAVPVARRVSPA
jgi:hypothetical protein